MSDPMNDIVDPNSLDEMDSPEFLAGPEVKDDIDAIPEMPSPAQAQAQSVKQMVRLAPSKEKEALAEGIHNIGTFSFEIPSAAEQAAGFEVENAGVLVSQYRQFKFVTDKGDSVPSVRI